MSTYVLIAGAWHGSWCWSELAPMLRAAGHRVLTPDLRGMDDGTAAGLANPLATWADQIAELVSEQKDAVVLVGHSRAGLVISEVAERVPHKIDLLVYLCAFLLEDGQSLQEVAQQAANAAVFQAATIVHGDGTATIDEKALPELFYNETPNQHLQHAQTRLVPEPLSSFTTPVHVSDHRYGTVWRAYIECTRDGAIPIASQRSMQAALPCGQVVELDSDHSPFFSMPARLAEVLERLPTSPAVERGDRSS